MNGPHLYDYVIVYVILLILYYCQVLILSHLPARQNKYTSIFLWLPQGRIMIKRFYSSEIFFLPFINFITSIFFGEKENSRRDKIAYKVLDIMYQRSYIIYWVININYLISVWYQVSYKGPDIRYQVSESRNINQVSDI